MIGSVQVEEQSLLVELRAGKSTAVRLWYSTYWPSIFSFVLSRVNDHAEAEEIAEEVFIACLRELPLFRADSGLKTWMYGVAKHKVADFFRARYAKKFLHAIPLPEDVSLPELVFSTETELTKQALARLSPDQKELLLAKYVDKKSVRELASELKTTVKSVESTLFRTRIAFKVAYQYVEASAE